MDKQTQMIPTSLIVPIVGEVVYSEKSYLFQYHTKTRNEGWRNLSREEDLENLKFEVADHIDLWGDEHEYRFVEVETTHRVINCTAADTTSDEEPESQPLPYAVIAGRYWDLSGDRYVKYHYTFNTLEEANNDFENMCSYDWYYIEFENKAYQFSLDHNTQNKE